MPYRDPLLAVRQRAIRARDDVAKRAERMLPELLQRLPGPLRSKLIRLRPQALQDGIDLDSWQQVERHILAYDAAICEAYRLAPRIDRSYNALPDDFPKRRRANVPMFDIYSPSLLRTRAQIHAALSDIDPQARLIDRRPGYYNQQDPLVVEAELRAQGHPLRLEMWATAAMAQHQRDLSWVYHFSAATLVRRSAPALRVQSTAMDRALAWLRLKRDSRIGDEVLDRKLVIDANPSQARRALSKPVRRALHELLAEAVEPELALVQGLARLNWRAAQGEPPRLIDLGRVTLSQQATSAALKGVRPAIELLVALRELTPVDVLAKDLDEG